MRKVVIGWVMTLLGCYDHLDKIDLSTQLDSFFIPNAYNQWNLTYLENHVSLPFVVVFLCLSYLVFSSTHPQILHICLIQISVSIPLQQFEYTRPHYQWVSHKLIYEDQQCTSAIVISPFYALYLPSFGNTRHDCWGPLQLKETHGFACETFFGIESLCIQDLVKNSHWTINHVLPHDFNSPLFSFVCVV